MSCHKIRYLSEGAANMEVVHMQTLAREAPKGFRGQCSGIRKPEYLRAYRCPRCGFWHVGNGRPIRPVAKGD